MTWDVRFGRFDRGTDQPILVKQKRGEGDSISTRIYQRKDLGSITNPITRMIKKLKYSFEDLCYDKAAVGKFFQLLGFPKINDRKILSRDSFEKEVTAFQQIESDARLGYAPSSESSQQLFSFLDIDNPPTAFTATVNPEKYDDARFLNDLENCFLGNESYRMGNLKVQEEKALKSYFTTLIKNIRRGDTIITDDKIAYEEYLKNRSLFKDAITESSKNNQGNSNALRAFLKKLDTVFPERVEELFDLSEMKGHALNKFATELFLATKKNQPTDHIEKASKNLKRIFSTSPWVTKKQKLEAMQYFLDEQKNPKPLWLPYSLLRYFEDTLKSQQNKALH